MGGASWQRVSVHNATLNPLPKLSAPSANGEPGRSISFTTQPKSPVKELSMGGFNVNLS